MHRVPERRMRTHPPPPRAAHGRERAERCGIEVPRDAEQHLGREARGPAYGRCRGRRGVTRVALQLCNAPAYRIVRRTLCGGTQDARRFFAQAQLQKDARGVEE